MVTAICLGVVLFVAGSALSYLAVGRMLHWAERSRMLAHPTDRSSHVLPMPTGGGAPLVAITLSLWVAYVAVEARTSLAQVAVYAIGASAIALVSWLDDHHHVHYRIRLAVHTFAAVLLVLGAGYWHGITLPVLGHIPLGYLGVLITVLWIVGLTNAFNFTDGIDGIAGSQALISGLGWAMLGLLTHQIELAVLGIFLAACSQGFLGHNWHPASIFMGDVGSTFFGFSFAAMPVIAAGRDPNLAVAGVLLMWPCLYDGAFTIVTRMFRGETVTSGHKGFLFHRLVLSGWKHSQVAAVYGLLSIMGLLFSYLWMTHGGRARPAVLIAVPLLCLGLWCAVLISERRHRRTLSLVPPLLLERPALEVVPSLTRSTG